MKKFSQKGKIFENSFRLLLFLGTAPNNFVFSRVHATLQPALSVRPSVRHTLLSRFTFLYYNVNS